MPTITDHEMERRRLVAIAGRFLVDAMDAFTTEHGELSAMEWMKATQSMVQRLIAEQLADEWKEQPHA